MAPSRSAARISLAAALLLLAFAPVAEAASKGSDGRPNVVVIMSDDQDFRSMGAMPKVRRLIAARGTTFATSISSYPLCCPSRATYYTGRYAHNHGVKWNNLARGRLLQVQRPPARSRSGCGVPATGRSTSAST